MAELLQRLLDARQRRRNPFQDVMGPDPLQSQAYTDAAQGTDVSAPASITPRIRNTSAEMEPAEADSGSPFKFASGGGGGAPVRTAEYSGEEAPVQQTGTRGRVCRDGTCYTTTTVSQPTPVQATVEPTIVSGDVNDLNTLVDNARRQEALGNPSGRALEIQAAGLGQNQQQLRLNEKIVDANIALQERAATYAKEEQRQQAVKIAADAAVSDATANLTKQQAQATREGTVSGRFDVNNEVITKFMAEGGDPETLAQALAMPAVQLGANEEGKPAPTGKVPNAMSIEQARTVAYGYHGVHLIVTSQQLWEAADKINKGDVAAAYPPQEGEDQNQYANRVYQQLSEERGHNFARAADQIVTGLSKTEEWKTGNWTDINTMLNSHVGGPLNRYMQGVYLQAQKDEIAALPPEKQEAAIRETVFRSQRDAGAVLQFLKVETLAAFTKSRGGNYDPNMSYSDNLKRAPAQYFGGDKAPASAKPADSNDTLPAVNEELMKQPF